MITQKGQSCKILGILKIFAFCWKIKQRASGPGESTARATYLSMRIHLKSYCIFPLILFRAAHNWGEAKRQGAPQNLSHISYNDETSHSYILPKEDLKKIYKSRDTPLEIC